MKPKTVPPSQGPLWNFPEGRMWQTFPGARPPFGIKWRAFVSKRLCLTLLLCLAFAGCSRPSSTELRKLFLEKLPLQTTTRADVEQQMVKDFRRVTDEPRPAGGWGAFSDPVVRKSGSRVEGKSQRTVERCQQYWGTHDVFSLSVIWFYFDGSDHLMEIEAYLAD